MKKNILVIATMMMERYGRTSTKEIKDALHRLFENDSTFQLGQKEVSDMMNELSSEQNWEKKIVKIQGMGISYFEYFLSIVTGINTLPKVDNTSNSQVTTQNVPPVPLDENNGKYVCYISGMPELFVQVTEDLAIQDTKAKAKKACFNEYKDSANLCGKKLTYDNLNFCTTKHYNKHVI